MSKSAITNYYDTYWTGQEGWTPQATVSPLQRKIFLGLITGDTVVLDVGCGDGSHYGHMLAKIAKGYYGLDVSEVAVESARRNGVLAQSHDLTSPFPFFNGMFDTVICFEVLEHLFDPAYTLSEMRRVLKSDGHMILSVPNVAHLSNRVRMLLGGFSPGGTPETASRRPWADPHIRFFTQRTFRAFTAEQNLQIDHIYGEGFGLFNTFPVLSPIAARIFGWKRLENWSRPFEFLARLWPSLCAGHLIASVTPRGK